MNLCAKPAHEIDLLVFDLGGVLVEWDGVEPLRKLSRRNLSREDARRFWLESPWVRRFETGQCPPGSFAAGVVEELDLRLDAEGFLRDFISWDRGPLPGARELLEELGRSCELGCLSNNNEMHWSRLRDEFGFGHYFKYCFISYEIGLLKPDREIFEFLLSHLPYPASRIAFFDDNPECVESALELGIKAFQVQGIDEVRRVLGDLRLSG